MFLRKLDVLFRIILNIKRKEEPITGVFTAIKYIHLTLLKFGLKFPRNQILTEATKAKLSPLHSEIIHKTELLL